MEVAWVRLSKLLAEQLEAKGDLAGAANISHELQVELTVLMLKLQVVGILYTGCFFKMPHPPKKI